MVIMKKQIFFSIFFALFSLFILGCQSDSDAKKEAPKQLKELKTISLKVQVNAPATRSLNSAPALYTSQNANFTKIDQITVEVSLDGTTVVSPKQMVKSGNTWTVSLDNILPNRNYSFIARAYENGVETFSGSTTRSFINETDNQVTIALNATEEIYLPIPKITQIIRPAKILADTTGDIRITVMGSSNETLTYEFKKDSSNDLGTFTPSSGQIALAGSSANLINQYRAPVAIGNYNFSIKVSNPKNNSVEGKFQIAVNDISGDISLQVNPVVHGIHVTCSGSQLVWNATAVGYDGTENQLSWQWQFDGSSDAFQNPNENGAILPNYNRNLSGPVKLTVTDNHTNGGTTIATYQLEQNLCPAVGGFDTLKVASFEAFQSIETNTGTDWEFFTIGSRSFLAVSNNNNGSSQNIASKIYEWDGASFVEFQSINTNGANDWESFRIGSDYYLAIANQTNGSLYEIPSKIYKWSGTNFEEFQSINTAGARSWKFFQIGTKSYLVIANYVNDSGQKSIPSKIYRWEGDGFVEFQSINTDAAAAWEFFEIGTVPYLAVANYELGSAHKNIPSRIYKWNGSNFELFQTIETNGPRNLHSFRIGSELYLAFANFFNDSTFDIPSNIYRWNGVRFELFQSINTHGAIDWNSFQIGTENFLVVANNRSEGSARGNIQSEIYRWSGTAFEKFQGVDTNYASRWETFQIDEQVYFAVINSHNGSDYNIPSKIYKARFEKPYPLFPKVNQVVHPTHMWTGETGEFQLSFLGDTNETLNYEFLQDTSPDLRNFTAKSGNITLSGTAATVTTNYQAPTASGVYNFRAKVGNPGNNSVETSFQIDIKSSNIVGFDEFQAIDTNAATSWEYFTIGSRKFLAVSNYYDSTSHETLSQIYEWSGSSFQKFQTIATQGAQHWEAFRIGSDSYLAVANGHTISNAQTFSKIYKWNGNSFEEFQSIATHGAFSWKFFQIETEHFLAVANQIKDSNWSTASKIYKWSGSSFEEFQAIETNGAANWEFFTIDSTPYLVVANHYNGTKHTTPSNIYKWNGTNFELFQSVETSGAYDVHPFKIGADLYLAAANNYNSGNYDIDSKIYKWNGTDFEEFQSIRTQGAVNWESIQIGSNTYLAITNNRSGANGNVQSVIYKWSGSGFEELQRFETNSAYRWETFQIDQQIYFVVANYKNNITWLIQSKIYKARFE